MKKIYITLLFALYGALAYGQQPTNEDKRVNQWLDYKQSIADQRAELMETRHQIRFGVGLYNSSNEFSLFSTSYNNKPVLTLDYSYRILEFLEIGAFVSTVSRAKNNYLGNLLGVTNGNVASEHYDDLNVGVYARYAWLNRKWISLYSSFGMMYSNRYKKEYSTSDPDLYASSIEQQIGYHLSLIGVRVGGRVFGYIEPAEVTSVGFTFTIGIGCKF